MPESNVRNLQGTESPKCNTNCCTHEIGWQTTNQRGEILLYNFSLLKVLDESWQFDLADKDRTLVTRSPCPVSHSQITCQSESDQISLPFRICGPLLRGWSKLVKAVFRWVILFQRDRIDWRRIRVSTSCQSVNGNIRIDTYLAFLHSDWSDGSHSDWSERSVVPTYPSPNPLETSSSAPLPHHLQWSHGPRSLRPQKQ